jgi:hypothetical protein
MNKVILDPERAGWSIGAWCSSADISRALLYRLPAVQQPKSVKVGKRRIICESPFDWLRRMASEQDVA